MPRPDDASGDRAIETPIFADLQTLACRARQGEPAATAALVRAFCELPPVCPPAWRELDADWRFALGDPAEGLNTSLAHLPPLQAPVSLPHRTLHPETPYWYVTEFAFPEPSVLAIRADDGAQLVLDGERIPIQGDHFFLPASPYRRSLVVRVLNQAMYGGLESVQGVSRADFDRFQREAEVRAQLAALVRKVRLLLAPTEEQIAMVLEAVHNNAAQALQEAQQRLSLLPLTLVGPFLQTVLVDRMSVVWETDVPCVASVEWGEGAEPLQSLTARTDGLLHVAELTSLKPGTAYRYRVRSGDLLSPLACFRTLPASGPFAFTVWSDPQVNDVSDENNAVFRQNIHAMRRLPMAFTVGLGDLVEGGNRQEPWLRFFETLTPLASETPVMLMGGNHDYDGCFEDLQSVFFDRYARNAPRSHYYAWTVSNARFVVLEPNLQFPTGIPLDSEQYRWFRRELEAPEWRRATWRFVFLHQPPYSQGWDGYHGDLPIRAVLDPLIEAYGIDFIVSGHTHDYERLTQTYGTQRVHLLIVGGAGGGLEDGAMSAEPVMDRVIRRHHFGLFQIDGRKVTFEAVATDTRRLDYFEVTR